MVEQYTSEDSKADGFSRSTGIVMLSKNTKEIIVDSQKSVREKNQQFFLNFTNSKIAQHSRRMLHFTSVNRNSLFQGFNSDLPETMINNLIEQKQLGFVSLDNKNGQFLLRLVHAQDLIEAHGKLIELYHHECKTWVLNKLNCNRYDIRDYQREGVMKVKSSKVDPSAEVTPT